MMKGYHWVDFFVWGIIIAGIGLLTKPGSQGVNLAKALGGTVVNFTKAVVSSGG